MKHLGGTLLVGGLVVGALGMSLRDSALAQAPAGAPAQTQAERLAAWIKPRHVIQPGTALYVSNEELKKSYPNLNELTMATVAATPAYRVSTVARPYYEPARMTPISKMSSHWDDGEMHEDMTQIYVILEGTGVIIVGGKAVHEASSRPGEHGGGPIEGGTSYKVKPGDWVVIPPLTWHQAQPDRGGLSYAMVHMSTRTNVP